MRAVDLTKLLVIMLGLQLWGCSLLQDQRDAAWDPRPGHSLLDQIANEEEGAERRCGGQLDPEVARRSGKSPRC